MRKYVGLEPMELAAGKVMRDLLEKAAVAAQCVPRVLITGEGGAGKTWLARIIHASSPNAGGDLIDIPIPDIGAEALADRLAHASGTILLRRIERLTLPAQRALMVWLDGASDGMRPRGAGLELLCTADRTLFQRVSAGTFRSDLFYRLNMIHLCVPPLRERPEDIGPLLVWFVRLTAARVKTSDVHIDSSCLSQYEGYQWPGNIRELQEVAEQIVLTARKASERAEKP